MMIEYPGISQPAIPVPPVTKKPGQNIAFEPGIKQVCYLLSQILPPIGAITATRAWTERGTTSNIISLLKSNTQS